MDFRLEESVIAVAPDGTAMTQLSIDRLIIQFNQNFINKDKEHPDDVAAEMAMASIETM